MDAQSNRCERDDEFLFEVYACARECEVRSWSLDDTALVSFLRMQHRLQLASYTRDYPRARHEVLRCAGERAGYACVDRCDETITLVDIALLGAFRNRGIGSAYLRALQSEASAEGAALRLSVRPDNRARALYERLGFQTVSADETIVRMEWRGSAA